MRFPTKSFRDPSLLVGLFFLLLSLALTSPLLSSSKIVGEKYEGGLSLWTTWFPLYSFEHNLDMFTSNQSLYPIKVNYLPVLSLPTSLLYYVLDSFLSSLLAYNLLYPLYLALTAWIGFLFFRRQLRHMPLAMVGGAVLAFNPITLQLARRGELALLGVFALPLWMLLWDRFIEQMTLRRLLAVTVGLYLVFAMSVQFWNLAFTLLLPYAIFRVYRTEGLDRGRLGEWLVVGGLIFCLLFLLYPASPLLWSTYGNQYPPLKVWQAAFSLDQWYWLVLGLGSLLAAVASLGLAWEHSPDRRWWMLIIGLNVLGFAFNQAAPLTQIGYFFRVPDNPALTRPPIFLFGAIIGASILILGAIKTLLSERLALNYAVYGSLAAGLFVTSGWWDGLPTSAVPQVDFYKALAAEPENYLVIDFPIGVDSLARRSLMEAGEDVSAYPAFGFDAEAGRTLVYMPQHHKRVVGGLTTHLSEADLAPYHDSALIRLLSFQPEDPDENLETRVQTIRREVERWRVGYIVMRPAAVPPEFADALRGWLNWIGSFCKVGSEGDLEMWRASWHPAGCPAYSVQIGGSDGVLAAGAGWYAPEYWDVGFVRWSDADAELKLWVDRPTTDFTLTLHGAANAEIADQSLEVFANGESLGTLDLSNEWADYSFKLPRLVIGEGGVLNLELRHSGSQVVDGRSLSAVYQTVSLEPIAP